MSSHHQTIKQENIAMVSTEERIKVLEMLQKGQITPDAAEQLLKAMGEETGLPVQPPAVPDAPIPPEVPSLKKPRWLRVRVTDTNSGHPRVNLRVPMALVNIGLKLGARYSPEVEGLDLQAIMDAADTLGSGPIVDVYDEGDGEHVEIFLE
jgi:hypothetical protein